MRIRQHAILKKILQNQIYYYQNCIPACEADSGEVSGGGSPAGDLAAVLVRACACVSVWVWWWWWGAGTGSSRGFVGFHGLESDRRLLAPKSDFGR